MKGGDIFGSSSTAIIEQKDIAEGFGGECSWSEDLTGSETKDKSLTILGDILLNLLNNSLFGIIFLCLYVLLTSFSA